MRVWLENAYSRIFWVFLEGTFSPNDVTHRRPNPKKDRPWAEPRHLSHKARISLAWFELSVGTIKKDRTGKSHKRVIFHLFVFQNEIFRGYDFTRGRISHFLIDF